MYYIIMLNEFVFSFHLGYFGYIHQEPEVQHEPGVQLENQVDIAAIVDQVDGGNDP